MSDEIPILGNEKPDREVDAETVNVTQQNPDRRRIFRKLLALAGLGITGVLFSQDKTGLLPRAEAIFPGDIAWWNGSAIAYDDNLSWDGSILLVKGTSHSISVSQATPYYPLDITGSYFGPPGSGTLQGAMRVSNSDNDTGIHITNFATNGHDYVLFSSGGTSGIGPGNFNIVDATAEALRLSITASGNVGIGTVSPARLVHLQGDNAVFRMDRDVDSAAFILVRTAVGNFSTVWKTFVVGAAASGVNNGSFFISDLGTAVSGAGTERFVIDNSGNVGIGTSSPDVALSVVGNADKSLGGASWGTFCDRRWKDPDSIKPFSLGLDWVRTLPTPVRFHYMKDNGINADPQPENVNFIAQDLLDGVHDNLVYETVNRVKRSDKEPVTMYGVNVNDMHFAMVNAIKELAEENRILREEVRALRSRMEIYEQTVKIVAC